MSHSTADGQVISKQFSNYDELAEAAKGWDLDFCQLDAGSSPADLFQCQTNDMQLSSATLNRHYHQRGSAPPGITFAVLDNVQQLNWLNYEVDESSLLAYREQGEIDCISTPGFTVYTLTYDHEALLQLENKLQSTSRITHLTRASLAATVDQKAMHHVRHQLKQFVSQLKQQPDLIARKGLQKVLENEIPRQIIHMLERGKLQPPVASPRVRSQALKRALELIEATAHEGITIDRLCQYCNVSDRTLEYAFREHFCKTPAAYIKARRLYNVRQQLRNMHGADTSISDIANNWGFWHMGQFAADYRRFFGELPSQTAKPGSL